jgi:hypothetical protein
MLSKARFDWFHSFDSNEDAESPKFNFLDEPSQITVACMERDQLMMHGCYDIT